MDIEKKALELVKAQLPRHGASADYGVCFNALCRAIEAHEAFRREVSDAVESLCNTVLMSHLHRQLREMLSQRFIIAKPDPLVEVLDECGFGVSSNAADDIRAAIEKRGGKIVWGEKQ